MMSEPETVIPELDQKIEVHQCTEGSHPTIEAVRIFRESKRLLPDEVVDNQIANFLARLLGEMTPANED